MELVVTGYWESPDLNMIGGVGVCVCVCEICGENISCSLLKL